MSTSFWQRTLIRLVALVVMGATLYFVVFDVFAFFNRNDRLTLALVLTYLVSAYLIFPWSVRLIGWITRRRHIPAYTSSVEGLPTDPVNIIVVGSLGDLRRAFKAAGWVMADDLNLRSAINMVKSFVLGHPYPTAPFSNLYLFGRNQDLGIQKPIGNNPRKRHHIRFWAYEPDNNQQNIMSVWHIFDSPDLDKARVWIGAATKDTGFGFTKATFQISHAVDADTVKEREFVVQDLKSGGHVTKTTLESGLHEIKTEGVNKFKTDGKVAVVYLK